MHLLISGKTVKIENRAKPLVNNIDDRINFDNHVEQFYKKPNKNLHDLSRVTKCMD